MNYHGERVGREQASPANLNYLRHLAGYRFVGEQIGNGRVLEVGCGSGYGLSSLAATHRNDFFAVDIDLPAVKDAKRGSAHCARLRYCASSGTPLSFRDSSFALTFALQVIEHVQDQRMFVQEMLRVTKPGGTIIFSTPNKIMYALENEGRANPYHLHEFEREELINLLGEFNAQFMVKGLIKSNRLRDVERMITDDRDTVLIRSIKKLGLFKYAAHVPFTVKRLLVKSTKSERLAASAIDASDFIVTDTADDTSLDFFAVISS